MRFEGIYTPIITPFHDDGSIDWDSYAEVIDWQIENGAAGIIVGGSTGEFYALSKKERVQQFRFAAERIGNSAEFVAGVNDIRVDECLEITAAARDAGARSLLVAAPPYSIPSEAELAHHVLKIADTSGLPIMLYNYPGRVVVEMGEEFLNIVSQNPQIVGKQGDFARGKRLMSAFNPLMNILEQGGKFLQCVKLGCELQVRPGGFVRPPLLPLEDALRQEMTEIVATTRDKVNTILNGNG